MFEESDYDDVPVLYDDDMCSIITLDGRQEDIIIAEGYDLNKYADLIHEDMIRIMKNDENKEGTWIFRFSKDISHMYSDEANYQ